MDTYRTTISDKRWIAYDIPGNIGWITWLICAVRGLREKREAGFRESAREKLDSLAKETAAKLSPEGKKAKPKARGPEH